jgi:hypothetical protein
MVHQVLEQITEGMHAYDADGVPVGTVEQVADSEAVGYLRVNTGFLLGHILYVPADAVLDVRAAQVYLDVDWDDLIGGGWDAPSLPPWSLSDAAYGRTVGRRAMDDLDLWNLGGSSVEAVDTLQDLNVQRDENDWRSDQHARGAHFAPQHVLEDVRRRVHEVLVRL